MYLGYNIHKSTLEDINFDDNRIINTINPHSYCVSKQDKDFETALKASNILFPDGIGIVLSVKLLNNQNIEKIAGADIHQYLLEKANLKSQRVFYLGAAPHTLKLIEMKVKKQFPNINVSSFSPPYKSQFSDAESVKMLKKVNEFRPDILFVGMTAPKQEKWVHKFKDELHVKNICCIGAVFDFYSGNIKRPSDFWINLGLEWLPRFVREPKRLFYRNFVSTPKFILEVLFFKFFGKGIL